MCPVLFLDAESNMRAKRTYKYKLLNRRYKYPVLFSGRGVDNGRKEKLYHREDSSLGLTIALKFQKDFLKAENKYCSYKFSYYLQEIR